MTDHGFRLQFAECNPNSIRFACTCGAWTETVPRTSGSHCEVTPDMTRGAHLRWATEHVAPGVGRATS